LIRRAIFRGLRFVGTHGGIGTCVQHESPTRISRRNDRETLNSVLTVLAASERAIASGPFESARPELAQAFYQLARSAYRHGYPEIAADALRRSRGLGFAGHHGTATHRLAAGLLGLQRKEKLAAATGRARSAIRRSDG
jgi:hypothetical protein